MPEVVLPSEEDELLDRVRLRMACSRRASSNSPERQRKQDPPQKCADRCLLATCQGLVRQRKQDLSA